MTEEKNEAPTYSDAQERLLRATLETINEVGVEKATTRRIAERAGVNLQLIQYHFGGKSTMIEEAQHYVVYRFFEEVGPAIIEAPNLAEAIRRGIDETWGLAQTRPEIVQPDLLLQTVRSGQEGERSPGIRRTQAQIADLLEAVMQRTGDRLRVPTGHFALLVTGGLGGLILEYRVTGDMARVAAAVGILRDLLISLVDPAEG